MYFFLGNVATLIARQQYNYSTSTNLIFFTFHVTHIVFNFIADIVPFSPLMLLLVPPSAFCSMRSSATRKIFHCCRKNYNLQNIHASTKHCIEYILKVIVISRHFRDYFCFINTCNLKRCLYESGRIYFGINDNI